MTVKLSQPWLSVSIKCEHELNEQMSRVFPQVDSLLTSFPIHPLPLHHTPKFGGYFIPRAEGTSVFCVSVCF